MLYVNLTPSHIVHIQLTGLQNYLCYSNSILYAKCGGDGKASSLAVAFLSAVLFFIGPQIASFIPRCMAGTLLLHIGIDLILEGVVDCKFIWYGLTRRFVMAYSF